tara:strand:- start:77337 stop:79520 length:2184 start_codon:yes stop_codon:yes gene_type:complete
MTPNYFRFVKISDSGGGGINYPSGQVYQLNFDGNDTHMEYTYAHLDSAVDDTDWDYIQTSGSNDSHISTYHSSNSSASDKLIYLITDGPDADANQSFTVSFWAKPLQTDVGYRPWFGFDTTGGGDVGYIAQQSNGRLGFWVDGAGYQTQTGEAQYHATASADLSHGKWHHVVWSWNGSDNKSNLYLDGELTLADKTHSAFANLTAAGHVAHFGGEHEGGTNWSYESKMAYHDFVVWTKVLTASEIKSLYGEYTPPAWDPKADNTTINTGSLSDHLVAQYNFDGDDNDIMLQGDAFYGHDTFSPYWKWVRTSGQYHHPLDGDGVTTNSIGANGKRPGLFILKNSGVAQNSADRLTPKLINSSSAHGGNFTVTTWLKVSHSATVDNVYPINIEQYGGGDIVNTQITDNKFGFYSGQHHSSVTSSSGKWQHVAIVYESDINSINKMGMKTLYIDGVRSIKHHHTTDFTANPNNYAFSFNSDDEGSNDWQYGDLHKGAFHDMRFYSKGLTDAEVLSVYNEKSGEVSTLIDHDIDGYAAGTDLDDHDPNKSIAGQTGIYIFTAMDDADNISSLKVIDETSEVTTSLGYGTDWRHRPVTTVSDVATGMPSPTGSSCYAWKYYKIPYANRTYRFEILRDSGDADDDMDFLVWSGSMTGAISMFGIHPDSVSYGSSTYQGGSAYRIHILDDDDSNHISRNSGNPIYGTFGIKVIVDASGNYTISKDGNADGTYGD